MLDSLRRAAILASEPAGGSWDIAVGMGALVLIAGGVAAIVRRSMRPGQALVILGIAAAVTGLTAAAALLSRVAALGTPYAVAVIGMITVGGMVMTVAVLTGPRRRR